jgi:predicted nucleic acid-binding protein
MSRALLDTDILSEVLKERDATVARAAADYLAGHGELTVSVISVMEIAYGLHRAGRMEQLVEFEATLATSCRVLPFDAPAALLARRIEADLEKAGTPIDAPDVMIAATALGARLPVVTGNTEHFEAVRKAGWDLPAEGTATGRPRPARW